MLSEDTVTRKFLIMDIVWVKSSTNGTYLKKYTTESKEKKFWVKDKLDPNAIFGMSDFFCLSKIISNSLNKGGKRLKDS